jgi:rod shape-determining protein MreC
MISTIQNLRTYIIFFIISTLLLLTDQLLGLSPLRALLELPIIPAKVFFYSQKQALDHNFLFLPDCRACQQRLSRARSSERQYSYLITQLSHLKEENASLRKLLGAPLPPEWKFLPARVIGQAPESISINQGQSQGVRQQMMVIAQGVLVGQISSTTERQSQVDLITSSTKIPSLVLSTTDQQQLAKGVIEYQDHQLILTKVLPGETLTPGDIVVTSGEGGFLPDVPVATIEKSFMDNPTDAFQKAILQPLADLDHLSLVEVVVDW